MSIFPLTLRTTLRRLARAPMFTAVAIVTLAVGIGATSAVFSVVHGVLLKPLPFSEPERLVGIWHKAPGLGFDRLNQSPALYFTYREEAKSFTDSGMYDNNTASVTGRGEPEEVPSMWVTDGVFPLLGVKPLHGRLFTPEDDSPGTAETVILSHAYWQERFGGDPAAIGQTLRLEGVPHEVIGVMPADLQFLDYEPSLYLPFQRDRAEVFFGNFSYQGIGRLAPGVTLEQANAEVERMIPMALDRFPPPEGFSAEMVEQVGFAANLRPLKEDVVGDVGRVLWVLLGTVGIVLLVACANVANLYLVRAEARRQELAVRSALGAGRGRIGREFLLESLVLAVAGGAGGLALAWAGIQLLTAMAPRGLPRLDEIGLDPAVVGFTMAVSALAALIFGVLPVFRLGGAKLLGALKQGGRGASDGRERHVARNTLVAAQIGLALVLLIASGLMIRSFQAMRSVDPGFSDPEDVLTLRLSIPEAEVAEPERVALMHEELAQKVAALPGVESVGLTSSITMDGWDSNDPVFVEDFPRPPDELPPLRRFKWVTPGYFETMGQPLVAGRVITWADIHERADVAVVTENLAREYWREPTVAVGRRIKPYPNTPWKTIVGVVGDIRDDGVDEDAVATVHWPIAMNDFFEPGPDVRRGLAYVIRSPRVGSPGLLDEVRRTIWSVDPNLPLAGVRTLDEILDRSMARTSFTLVMLVIAAGTALLLGGIGIYGVTSYAVAQRRREIGVRMALGAQRRDVGGLVLRHGLVLATIGVAVGLAAAFGLTRLMSALLYGVGAVDPLTYALGGVGAVALALTASWLPARRAASVDPIETLRWQ